MGLKMRVEEEEEGREEEKAEDLWVKGVPITW